MIEEKTLCECPLDHFCPDHLYIERTLLHAVRVNALEEAATLCESQEDFCCGGATLRCAKAIRALK